MKFINLDQLSGSSKFINLDTASFGSAGQTYIDPATLNLSSWLDARDFTGASYPAQFTWMSRNSAGSSGTRRAFRGGANYVGNNPPTTNPVAALVGGKQTVYFEGGSVNGGVPYANAKLANNSTPTTALVPTDIYSNANGASLSMVVKAPHTTSPNNYAYSQIFGSEYRGASSYYLNPLSVLSADTGPSLYMTATSAPIYTRSADVPASGTTLILIQAYWSPTNLDRAYIRVGKGPWTTFMWNNSSPPTMVNSIQDVMIAGAVVAGAYSEPPTTCNVAELMTSADVLTQSQFDQLADRAANVWEITL